MSPRERWLRDKSEVEIISGGAFLGLVFLWEPLAANGL